MNHTQNSFRLLNKIKIARDIKKREQKKKISRKPPKRKKIIHFSTDIENFETKLKRKSFVVTTVSNRTNERKQPRNSGSLISSSIPYAIRHSHVHNENTSKDFCAIQWFVCLAVWCSFLFPIVCRHQKSWMKRFPTARQMVSVFAYTYPISYWYWWMCGS